MSACEREEPPFCRSSSQLVPVHPASAPESGETISEGPTGFLSSSYCDHRYHRPFLTSLQQLTYCHCQALEQCLVVFRCHSALTLMPLLAGMSSVRFPPHPRCLPLRAMMPDVPSIQSCMRMSKLIVDCRLGSYGGEDSPLDISRVSQRSFNRVSSVAQAQSLQDTRADSDIARPTGNVCR